MIEAARVRRKGDRERDAEGVGDGKKIEKRDWR
jgi:hypothetical protein